MTGVFVAGLALLGCAALVDLVAGVSGRLARALPYLACAAGCVLLTAVGASDLAGHPARIDLGTFLG